MEKIINFNEHVKNNCRVCSSKNVLNLMNFGKQPNTFNLLREQNEKAYLHELNLSYCQNCGFTYIENPMPAEEFYTNYRVSSSIYPAKHLNWLVEKLVGFMDDKNDFIVDVGSNDGNLLNMFVHHGYNNVLGVEPTKDCSEKANIRGIKTINKYYDASTAENIKDLIGVPKILICSQVIEHIWDLNLFVENLSKLMDRETLLVLEFPSFETISNKGDFTSIWEQHVNYFSLDTISILLSRHNLSIQEKNIFPFSSGSWVLFIRLERDNTATTASQVVDLPIKFREKAIKNISALNKFVEEAKLEGKKIVIYGAGAKGAGLINLSGIGKHIDYVVDDNKDKVGLYLPGTGIPIFSTEKLCEDVPEYCIISPFNVKENELKVMEREMKYTKMGGKFIELFEDDFRNSEMLKI